MDLTERVPELRPLRLQLPMVLDGELVGGWPGAAHLRHHAAAAEAPRPVVARPGFRRLNLLWLNGTSLVDWPCEWRRELLEAVELPAGACVTRAGADQKRPS